MVGVDEKHPKKSRWPVWLQRVTEFLFVTTQVAALLWVSSSYMMAAYATVKLGQPYPVESLSSEAIRTLLGVAFLKVLQNIFEKNDGGIFGHSNTSNTNDYDEGA